MATAVCRVCLIGNIRMLRVDSAHLLKIYEKLTNTKLNTGTESGTPSTICYVCHWQLQRCYRFSDMANKSNKILQELLHITDEEIYFQLNKHTSLDVMHNLMVTSTEHMSVNNCCNTSSPTAVAVKEEQIVLKEETSENEEIDIKTYHEFLEIGDDSSNTEPTQEIDNNVINDSKNTQSIYHCDVCNQKFTTKLHIVKHLKLHTGEKPFTCTLCDKAFNKLGSLARHMQIHTKKKLYACNVCDKAFNRPSDLTRHIHIHTGEKPYSCNVCNRAFNQNSSLKSHMRIHTGDRPYSCNVCEKGFNQPSNLKIHMRIHTGEKPYSCKWCDKAFNQQSNLTSHMLIHTEERPYSCKLCDKAFNLQTVLIRHMRIHAGKKLFSCNMCDKIFNRQSKLTRHMRIHTDTGEKL